MERPILFNTEMVQAILEGRKNQTRRLLKPQPIEEQWPIGYLTGAVDSTRIGDFVCGNRDGGLNFIKPPCQTEDILWVRETWVRENCHECLGNPLTGTCDMEPDDKSGCYMYRASHEIYGDVKWKPSIHMPKEAARLFLKVTNIRVERLQEITPDDCEAEGMDAWIDDGVNDPGNAMYLQFKNLWDRLNLKHGFGWDANPWVWVVEFEKITA